MTTILGIETSCDETGRGAVTWATRHRAVVGRVEPGRPARPLRRRGAEIASRAHVELLTPVIAQALVEAGVDDDDVDAVAATVGPGLVGSLLVGVSAAKALALVWDVPFVGVNHLEAHLYASFLEEPEPNFPIVVLLVSGGHTMLVPDGGPRPVPAARVHHRRRRRRGVRQGRPVSRPRLPGRAGHRPPRDGRRPNAIRFPGRCSTTGYDFSFSGLKTAVVNYVRKHPDVSTADVCASFQEAVVDVLVAKARRAAAEVGATAMCLGGGVAANSLLRERFLDACVEDGLHGFLPSRAMCTDNAAMVAAAGFWRLRHDGPTPLDAGADPNLGLL